jgi:hypothetical protein
MATTAQQEARQGNEMKDRPARKSSQGVQWLPIACLERTGPGIDRLHIPVKPNPASQGEEQRRKRAGEQGGGGGNMRTAELDPALIPAPQGRRREAPTDPH